MSSDKQDVKMQAVDTTSSPSSPVPIATPSPSLPHHHYPSRPSYSSSTSSLDRFRSLAAESDVTPSSPIAIALEAPIGPTDDDAFDPPDGGLRAWSQVFAAHLINAMTWGYAGSYGVYQLYYEQHMDLPASQVSWIGSVQIFLTFATCALSGRLSDAGYARATACTGCFLAVLGSFMTSVSTEYWQFLLAQGVCVGLGLGIAFMPGVSVMSSYFKRNRPFALSVAAMGTSLGGVVFPATVQYVTPKLGFHWATRCAAFIALVFSVTACLLLRPYLPARKAGPWVEWAAFRERTYLLFSLGCFLNFYAMYFGFFYASEPPSSSFHTSACSDPTRKSTKRTSTDLNGAKTDKQLRPQQNRVLNPRVYKPSAHHKLHGHSLPASCGLPSQQFLRPHQRLHRRYHRCEYPSLLLDWRFHARGHVCL